MRSSGNQLKLEVLFFLSLYGMKVEEPIAEYGQLDLGKTYTYLQYLTWKFEDRVELIKGKIFKMSPAPSKKHQLVLGELHVIFHNTFKKHKCTVFFAPFDVRLPIYKDGETNTVVQPDLCVVCNEGKLDEKGCNGVPDIIVEVLSPTNSKHDLQTKFELYEEVQVPEYWIVNPHEKFVTVYTLADGKYVGSMPYINEDEVIVSKHLPALKLNVGAIFEGI
jgi:Uma2 family endonuclease